MMMTMIMIMKVDNRLSEPYLEFAGECWSQFPLPKVSTSDPRRPLHQHARVPLRRGLQGLVQPGFGREQGEMLESGSVRWSEYAN
jgi:hypothetical protein